MEAIDIIKSGLANSKRVVDRTLEGLTHGEIAWQPRPDANSIGLILFHMARSEDSFTNSMIQNKPEIWESGKWYEKLNKTIEDTGNRYTPEQVNSFLVPDVEALRAYTDEVRKHTLQLLDGMTAEKLSEKVKLERPMPFEPVVGDLLTMNVTHLAQHSGEISYIRGLKRGMDK